MFRALLISIHSECSQLASSATSTPCWVSISIWKPLYCQARYFFKKLNQLRTSVLNKGLKQRGKNYLVRNGGKNTSFSVALELDKNWLFLCPPEITSTEKLVFEKMPGKTQKKKSNLLPSRSHLSLETGQYDFYLPGRLSGKFSAPNQGSCTAIRASLGCWVLAKVPSNPELR